MRAILAAAIVGVGLTLSGVAAADPWTDPAGRLSFNAPQGWQIDPQAATGQTVVLAFNPSSDCYLFGIPNPNTSSASADATRNATAPIAADAWVRGANVLRDFFPNNSAQLVSQSVDTSGFWPVQRAELTSGSRTVFAAISGRPGFELRAFCSGASSAEAYSSVFASLGHPNDATWQAAAQQQASERQTREAAAAEAAAQAAAAQETPQPAEAERNRRRRN